MLNFEVGFYIFRKDLRIKDNRGLIKLSEHVKYIIPIFIFDTNQIDININNKTYLSFPAIRFLCESFKDLYEQIKNQNGIYIFFMEDLIML